MAKLSPQGIFHAQNLAGTAALSGGLLYTYEAGGSTPKATYTTSAGDVANANPVVLDANGNAKVWLDSGSYKYVLKDSAGVEQWTEDNIIGDSIQGYLSTITTTAGNLAITTSHKNNLIVCTAAITLTLLSSATAAEGFLITVKNTSTGNVTLTPDGSDTIDGAATYVVAHGTELNLVSDGTNWIKTGIQYMVHLDEGTAPSTPPSGEAKMYIGTDKEVKVIDDAGTITNLMSTIGCFHATLSANQALANASHAKILFNTETYDTQGWYDNATNHRFTPLVAGKYEITLQLTRSSTTADRYLYAEIYKNGALHADAINTTPSSDPLTTICIVVVDMNGTTDYLEAWAFHNDGASQNILYATNRSSFSAIRVA